MVNSIKKGTPRFFCLGCGKIYFYAKCAKNHTRKYGHDTVTNGNATIHYGEPSGRDRVIGIIQEDGTILLG